MPCRECFVRPAAEWEAYTQPEPPGAAFKWVLKEGELPGLVMGQVSLSGPMRKTPASHEWDQVYLVLTGRATVHLGRCAQQVEGRTLVVIPRGTLHWVEVAVGERIEYVYVNR